MYLSSVTLFISLVGSVAARTFTFDRSDNLAAYWGQNISGDQQSLVQYCQDDTVDVIMAGFVHTYNGTGGQPEFNFANVCSPGANGVFDGTNLPKCQFMTDQIQKCQEAGKVVLISLGGGTGNEKVVLSSQDQARELADTIWNEFLGGSSPLRPLGAAVLDGVDLDVERGGAEFVPDFVNRIRLNSVDNPKKFYVTAAPQCFKIPDDNVGQAIEKSNIDAVWVQFYNNGSCDMNSKNYTTSLDAWMKYLDAHAFNKNMKVFLGSAVDQKAAPEGSVDSATLAKDITQAKSTYASQFGGTMIFDITEAVSNSNYNLGDLTTALRAGEPASKRVVTPVLKDAASKPAVSSRFIRPDYIRGRRLPGTLPS